MPDLLTDGYTVVRLLSESDAKNLRGYLLHAYYNRREFGDDIALYNVYTRFPDLWSILLAIGSLTPIRSRLGDRVLHLRHASAQFGKWSSWHRDTYGQHSAGFRLCEQPDYAALQTVLVLQPFGLDFMPGSHLQAALKDPEPPASYVTPAVQAGDLIVFDTRIRHRGTPVGDPDNGRTRFYAPECKVILVGLFTGSYEAASEYHAFIETLRESAYRYLQHRAVYPIELVQQAVVHGIELL